VWLPGNERVEQVTTVAPSGRGLDELPTLPPGATLVAFEVRCESTSPGPTHLARSGEILKRALKIIGAYGGVAIPIRKRGIAGYWEDTRTGTEQAARALCALARRTGSRDCTRDSNRVPTERESLGVGVVLVDEALAKPRKQAFRLAALAHPNRLYFSSGAYERVVEQFDFQGLQPVVPKSERLEAVFELIGPKPERSGTHHVGREKVPMVGRRELLETIERCRCEAATGKVIAVHLVAEPGQGKSKLIREWLAEGDRLRRFDGWLRLSCNGVPYGNYSLRSWRRLIAPLIGAGNTEIAARTRAPQAIANKLRALRQRAILVIDDVHWIDSDSLDLIVRLMSALPASLVILAYRPSFAMKMPPVASATHRRFQIAPLGVTEMNGLVEILTHKSGTKWPAAAKREIVEKSHGSPLYVEEAIAHLAQVGPSKVGKLPTSLIELLILRAEWAAQELLPELERRRRAYQFGGMNKQQLLRELEELEEQLSAWLDRFDVIEEESTKTVTKFVRELERVDGELAILNILVGRQRTHRNRLAQGLTRVRGLCGDPVSMTDSHAGN
jgi:hypothetical protein